MMRNATLIVTLTFVAAAVTLAAFIGSRLSEQTVALLTGLIFGLLLGLPIGAIIGWFVRGQRSPERMAVNTAPMVYVTPPPQQPVIQGYAISPAANSWNGYSVGPGAPTSAPRQFVIGGEELIYHESDAIR